MDHIELQQFNKVLLLLIFLFGGVSLAVGFIFAYSQNPEIQQNENITYILPSGVLGIMGLIFYLLSKSELELSVNRYGLTFRYAPFVRKEVLLDFNEMESWRINSLSKIKYPLKRGYNRDMFRKKTSIILRGHDFIEVILKNGKIYYFSTIDQVGLSSAMKKYASNKELRSN